VNNSLCVIYLVLIATIKTMTIKIINKQHLWTNITTPPVKVDDNITHVAFIDSEFDVEYIKFFPKMTHLRVIKSETLNDDAFIRLTQLEYLHIQQCNNVNDGIKHLRNITHLKLSSCQNVNGSIIKSLSKLHHLSIRNCNNITREHLEGMHNLRYLAWEVDTETRKFLGVPLLRGLETIKMDFDIVDDDIMRNLPNVHNIYFISYYDACNYTSQLKRASILNGNHTSHELVFSSLSHLEALDYASYNKDNIVGEEISYLRDLSEIDLEFCYIEDGDLFHHLSNVDAIAFGTSISKGNPLRHLSKVKRIDIQCNLDNNLVIDNFDDIPNVEILSIDKRVNVKNASIRNLHNLRVLYAPDIIIPDDELHNMPQLEYYWTANHKSDRFKLYDVASITHKWNEVIRLAGV
jgi:hypothetical protein